MKKILLLVACLVSVPSVCLEILVPDPYYKSENCPKEKPFTNYAYVDQDRCLGCDALGAIYVEGFETDFEVCPERETVDGYSRLKKCPDNFFRDIKGNCVPCNERKFVRVNNESDCAVCKDRQVETVEYRSGISTEGSFLSCQLKTCPSDAPLSVGGDCLPCDQNVFPTNAKEACEKCSNRMFLSEGYTVFQNDEKRMYIKKDICISTINPPDPINPEWCMIDLDSVIDEEKYSGVQMGKSFIIGAGCVSTPEEDYRSAYELWTSRCDARNSVRTLPEICARCPNREYVEGECVFKRCPDGSINGSYYPQKSENTNEQFEEKCFSCEILYPIYTTKENCHQCGDKVFLSSDDGEWGKCLACHGLEKEPEYNVLSSDEKARCTELNENEEDVKVTFVVGEVALK